MNKEVLVSLPALPLKALAILLRYLLLSYTRKSSGLDPDEHVCSLSNPCCVAFAAVLAPILSLRLVSADWDVAISTTLHALNRHNTSGSNHASLFFKRVEDAYYPHAWHINTKVRNHVLLRRFRVYQTISSESGDRGVYLAYDFGSCNSGCLRVKTVIVKAWSSPDDNECITEKMVYGALHSAPVSGIPDVLASAPDSDCGVHAIVLQYLGPTLDDVIQVLPEKKLDERMVLSVAMQMIDRYREIHGRGVIHNGMKPANICLPPPTSPTRESNSMELPDRQPHTLYAIDFGLSSFLSAHEKLPRDRRADTVGNRWFLSVFGHHGITLSQRDDLESLAYLLSFLSHGHLPWAPPPLLVQSSNGKKSKQPQPQLWRIKMSTPASVLFEGMDSSFVEFWKDVKGLAFGEFPDYTTMRRRFEQCWISREYSGRPGVVDWGAVVGPIGLIHHG